MIILFNAQLLDVSMNSSTLANTVGANGQISYDYEEGKIYVHDGFGNRFFSNTLSGVSTYSFQGTVSGYTSGGYSYIEYSDVESSVVDKFSFTSDANATDVGDLTVARRELGGAGQSSTISGYTSGGSIGIPVQIFQNTIDKFPFATDANATDVGDMTVARRSGTGQSSTVSGYISGGFGPTTSNVIEKFPFAADANATDVGDLTQERQHTSGQSSTESGYTAGGATVNTIDKFPFSIDANATDVGDLTQARYGLTGQSSDASGYASGGFATLTTIDKFPFATDANATDVGDLTRGGRDMAGQSSTVSGYNSGGNRASEFGLTIDKFPFAADANATDVGDLTVARSELAGQQV